MEYNEIYKYVAYIGIHYNRESFRKILNIVANYNAREFASLKLVLEGVPTMEYQDGNDIINLGFINLMSSAFIKKIRVVIFDYPAQVKNEDILKCMRNGVIFVVNECCIELKNICIKYNCGLYYTSDSELMVALKFVFNESNENYIRLLQENARMCFEKQSSIFDRYKEFEDEFSNKMEKINSIIREETALLSPWEKVARVSSRVQTADSILDIVCKDEIEASGMLPEILLVFHYIKLYVNPNARMFLEGRIKDKDSTYKLLNAQVKELDIQDVMFEQMSANDSETIVLTGYNGSRIIKPNFEYTYLFSLGLGESKNKDIYLGSTDIPYIAELINHVLYVKKKGEGYE